MEKISKYRKLFLTAIFSLLVAAPFLIWGNNYLVGGDDTKLYYIFPKEFLKNFAFNIISDNTLAGAMTGYAPVSYFAPFFAFILIIKFIPLVNPQMLLYGLNFAFGFYFFYKLINLWLKPKGVWEDLIQIFSSIFYISSVYLTKTLYSHQLIAMYLVSVFPATLYFFIKGVREKKFVYTILSVIIFSVLTTTLNTLPWWGGFAITLSPILIYEFYLNPKSFLKNALVFVILFFFLNFYWIFHVLYSSFGVKGLSSTFSFYSSKEFLADNLRVTRGVAGLYYPLNFIFNRMDYNLLFRRNILEFLPGVFFIVIASAGLVAAKIKDKFNTLYITFLSGFLISWFFLSPNLGEMGISFFLFLSKNVPLFTMFRNMHDKFSQSLAFYYAVLLGIALIVLYRRVSKKLFNGVFVLVLAIFSLLYLPQNINHLRKTTESFSKFSGEFNQDFRDLVDYLKVQPNENRIAWFPLNGPTYANISDAKDRGQYYSGLSPIRVLADKTDFAGRFSFITSNDLFLGDEIFQMIKKEKYEEVGEIFQKHNIRYIIEDKEKVPDNLAGFMYGGNGFPVLKMQNEDFYHEILGKKIRDFGARYSLYEINAKYVSDRIYLTEDFGKIPKELKDLKYKKLSSHEYSIELGKEGFGKSLVFLDPFYEDWKLYIKKEGRLTPINFPRHLVFNYANGWQLTDESLKKLADSSNEIELRLRFEPNKYSNISYLVSGLALAGCIFVLSIYFLKKNL